jgi:hypothetical protein
MEEDMRCGERWSAEEIGREREEKIIYKVEGRKGREEGRYWRSVGEGEWHV